MPETTVLVTDYTWASTEPEAQVLAEVGAKLLIAESGSEQELVQLAPRADAILTCFAQVTPAVIRAAPNLRVIGRYGIGVDNIAVDEATARGIPVTNVPAYCLDEVSEHALAFMFALARNVCRYNTALNAGNWDLKTGMPMYRMNGRTLGILGFGKIGQTLAAKARGLGLKIIAHDPHLPAAVFAQHAAEAVDLETLFARADFISIHMPLTPQTRHMVNQDLLGKMKPTAFLVNTSRGGVVDQSALLLALQEGWLAGAGLDVFEPERLSPEHPLLHVPNLIATPHVAFYSEESVVELEVKAAQNVAAILAGRRPAAVVNPQVLALARWSHLV